MDANQESTADTSAVVVEELPVADAPADAPAPATGGDATPAQKPAADNGNAAGGEKPAPLHHDPAFRGDILRRKQLQEDIARLEQTRKQLEGNVQQTTIPQTVDEEIRRPLQVLMQQNATLQEQFANLQIASAESKRMDEIEKTRSEYNDFDKVLTEFKNEVDQLEMANPNMTVRQLYWAVKGPRMAAQREIETKRKAAEALQTAQRNRSVTGSAPAAATSGEPKDLDEAIAMSAKEIGYTA